MEVFGYFLFWLKGFQFSNDVCGYEFGWPYLVRIPFSFLFLGWGGGEIHVIGCQNNVDFKYHKKKKNEVASGLC